MEEFNKSPPKKNCLACKIISVGCLTGIGSYLIYTSIKFYSGKPKFCLGVLGAGTICLGAGEIFDKSPFRS